MSEPTTAEEAQILLRDFVNSGLTATQYFDSVGIRPPTIDVNNGLVGWYGELGLSRGLRLSNKFLRKVQVGFEGVAFFGVQLDSDSRPISGTKFESEYFGVTVGNSTCQRCEFAG